MSEMHVQLKCDSPHGYRVLLVCDSRTVDLEPGPLANDKEAQRAVSWWSEHFADYGCDEEDETYYP